MIACVAVAAMAAAAAALSAPARVIDGHVHITNFSQFSYSGWANASAGVCPCAPPCACNWQVSDWQTASSDFTPSKFVFIEVDADQQYWAAEAAYIQSLSDSGADGGKIGGIVARAPPGFGQTGVPDSVIDAYLAQLQAIPLVRGVRSYQNFSDVSSFPVAVSHTRLLAARGLSLDVCLGSLGGDPTASAFVVNLTAAVPSARFVLDHLGSPPALGTPAALAVWNQTVVALGARPNVYAKIGGAFQYFKPCLTCPAPIPTVDQVQPYVLHVLSSFGWDRSLFEANWFFVNWYAPANLSTYSIWAGYLQGILAGMTPQPTDDQLDALYYGTAAVVYRVVE